MCLMLGQAVPAMIKAQNCTQECRHSMNGTDIERRSIVIRVVYVQGAQLLQKAKGCITCLKNALGQVSGNLHQVLHDLFVPLKPQPQELQQTSMFHHPYSKCIQACMQSCSSSSVTTNMVWQQQEVIQTCRQGKIDAHVACAVLNAVLYTQQVCKYSIANLCAAHAISHAVHWTQQVHKHSTAY